MAAMDARRYRPEIDGLRAVAVIGVVMFHLGLGFPGGFVGVDVFFVISGYLITGILLRQLNEGRFSLVDFWARRVRRIAPAALVMVVVTLLIGGFLQTPDRYASLARSAMAHVVMASNCYFTRDQGYFAESSDLEPLLHTWSLSVEEQFYLIFPLLMVFVWKRWNGRIFLLMAVAAVASFAWSLVEVPSDPQAAFFLLPSRGWELLAGAMLAAIPASGMARRPREVVSALGLILVLAPMFLFGKETAFPGPAAIPPVLGAALLIYAGGATLAGRVLSARPLVGIGLISYSLYLWHWPLTVFAREVSFELPLMWKLAILVASLTLGYLSWRWIETPFRTGSFLGTKKRSLRFGALSAVLLFSTAWGIWNSGGMPSRLPERSQQMISDLEWNGGEYSSAKSKATQIGERSKGPLDFVLWGDSHGASAAAAVDEVGKKLGLRGRGYLNNGTPPVPGLFFADMDQKGANKMIAMNERVLAEIIESKPPVVILVGRWVARCEGYNAIEMTGETPDHRFITMVVDSPNPDPTYEEASGALARRLKSLHQRLTAHGIELLIMQQVPESTVNRVAARFYAQVQHPKASTLVQFSTTRAEFDLRQGRTMAMIAGLGIGVIDPTSQFFGENDTLQIYGERAYYRDDDHLTKPGSLHYLAPVFEKVLSR